MTLQNFVTKVKLATQILSKSVMLALQESDDEEFWRQPRFAWLVDVFLRYLDDWKQSTLDRPGNFSPDERAEMFLSPQTYEGLKIAVHSHIEAIYFLLGEGFPYVLPERFMHVLEDYFGHQRSKGGRSNNPTAQQFGYNDLTIAAQRDIPLVIRGNVGGRYEKKKWVKVSDEPVHKRKKVTKTSDKDSEDK